MIPLTRVEKEHIFSIFYKEKPNLYLVSKKKTQRFSAKHYINENGIIRITKDTSQFINSKKVFAFFFHKKIKICFPIVLENGFCFNLPDVAYIKQKRGTNTPIPILQLFYQNLLISTFRGANTKHSRKKRQFYTNNEVRKILNFSKELGNDLVYLLKAIKQTNPHEINLYPHIDIINDFLLKKRKGKIKKSNFYLFSDSNIILLFTTSNFAKQFNGEKELMAKIVFNNRNIFCNVKYNFFSPFLEKDASFSNGFLLFKITNIQEEDKRYLYEDIYTTHYGSFR